MVGGTSALTSALQLEGDCQLREKNPTPSPEAAASLTIQIIDLLLQAVADINLRDAFGSTALHKAASWSSPAVLRHLLLRGADPFAVEDESAPSQPLDYAIKSKRPEIAAILRDAMERYSSSKGPP
jgi:ankyrin repeat protein